MERRKPIIRLPATFICTMTDAEATNRTLVAKRCPGVKFRQTGVTEDGRIIGRTVVTNLVSLEKFNRTVFRDFTNKSSGGKRKSSS